MLRFLLFALCWIMMEGAVAQDWATVRVGDTAYFMGGRLSPVWTGRCDWNGPDKLLRIQYTDSAKSIGSDSIFYFPRGIRGKMMDGCVDTAAPSWLGYRAIRKAGGLEYYFNAVADTIAIRTQAGVGDFWVLVKDTFGRTFRATLSAIGVDTVNGAVDSMKTVSIQAYLGGNPVSHPYNTRILQWSKSHG